MKKLTTEQFIERSRKKHGDRYDYSLVDYKNNYTKVKIVCSVHGKFKQQPGNHLNYQGCPKCGLNKQVHSRSSTIDQFIKKSMDIHSYGYSYRLAKYVNSDTKLTIVCPIHGNFKQTPYHHINRKQGCPKCSGQGYDKQYSSNNIPVYDTYAKQLDPYGVKCRRSPQDTNILEVKCMYCDKWHQPTLKGVRSKIACINGKSGGEANLYCSDGCKQACPTFGQVTYPKGFKRDTSREVQPALRKLVLARDNWTCQKCHSTEDGLHCRHMEGIEINPVESADIDMCITLCKDCHNKLHKRYDCNMRRRKCD